MSNKHSHALSGPSANRLSISYAARTKCLVINAEIVEKLKIHRSNELNGIIVGTLLHNAPKS